MASGLKALVVGLGSMGQRRVRNLRALAHSSIAGFDVREDRRSNARQSGVAVFASFDDAVRSFAPDVIVVSTSPEHHLTYARHAVDRRIPCFIEASVVDAEGILALHECA